MLKFDHIGIIAPTLTEGRGNLATYFQIRDWTEEFVDPGIRVYVQFGRDASGICYEIIAPYEKNSPIQRALNQRSSTINHVAYIVTDLALEASRLRSSGAVPTGHPQPAVAYDGRNVQFFFTPMNFIIELIEAPDHHHQFSSDRY